MLYYMSAYMFVTPKDLVLPLAIRARIYEVLAVKVASATEAVATLLYSYKLPSTRGYPRLKLQALASNPR